MTEQADTQHTPFGVGAPHYRIAYENWQVYQRLVAEANPLHWDSLYGSRLETEVSWFEPSCDTSLALIDEAGAVADSPIIDIGGGASRLVDALLDRGYSDLTVLDLSAEALEVARRRLGPVAARIAWIVADVTKWTPARRYGLWHDRAAFHFLTDLADQRAYAEVMHAALAPGGVAVIGTFAPDGPDRCSGLPVARHDADDLGVLIGPDYALFATRRHDHVTPKGVVQRFQYSGFRRKP
ncbi:MAG: class I SAM-dependent methyltransferase [Cucumibacter sp.]